MPLVSVLGWLLVAGLGYVVASKSVRKWSGPGGDVVEEGHSSHLPEIVGGGAMVALACYFIGVGIGAGSLGGGRGGGAAPAVGAPNTPTFAAVHFIDSSTVDVTLSAFSGSGSDTHDSTRITIRRLAGDTLIDSIAGAVTRDTLASNANLKADTSYVFVARYKGAAGGWSGAVVDTFINSTWPNNEPSGMTQLIWGTGNSKTFGMASPTFSDSPWNNNDSVQADLTSSGSRYGTVVRKRVKAGYGSEWHGILTCNGFSSWNTAYKEVYFRWIVKYSSNYDVHSSGEKHFYWGGGGTGNANDYYVLMASNREIGIHNQVSSAGFTQVLSGDLMSLGAWHTFELRIRHESASASSNDGVITLWMDGDTIYNNVAVNWRSTGDLNFRGLQVYGYWGGAGDTKSVTDSIDISEFYVSGKN